MIEQVVAFLPLDQRLYAFQHPVKVLESHLLFDFVLRNHLLQVDVLHVHLESELREDVIGSGTRLLLIADQSLEFFFEERVSV